MDLQTSLLIATGLFALYVAQDLYKAWWRRRHPPSSRISQQAEALYRGLEKSWQRIDDILEALPTARRRRELLAQAEAHAAEGRWAEAATAYQEVLRLTLLPRERAGLLNLIALIYLKQGALAEAASALRQGVEIAPQEVALRQNYGFLLTKMGRHGEALEQLDKALKLAQGDAGAHNNYAMLLADMGRQDEALEHLRKALEIAPQFADAHNNCALLLWRIGQPDQALKHLHKALEIDPKSAVTHTNYANLLWGMRRGDEAEKHYRMALEINPQFAGAHFNFGLLLSELGRRDEALEHLRKALEIDPQYAHAHNNYAFLLAQMERSREAETHYRKALELFLASGETERAEVVRSNLELLEQAMKGLPAAAPQPLPAQPIYAKSEPSFVLSRG